MPHVLTGCDQCGGTDDHPKMHVAEDGDVRSYHHDCLPARVRDANRDHPHLPGIVAAAESGVRGDDLRAHIAALHGRD